MRVRINLTDRRWMQLVLFLLYRVLLSFIYSEGVVPTYSYLGYLSDYNIEIDVACWVIFTILSIRLIFIGQAEEVTFSKSAIYTLFLLIYAPFSIAVSHGMYNSNFIIANNIYWIVLIFFYANNYKRKLRSRPRIVTGTLKIDEKFINVFGFVSLVLILFISWRYTGFRINLSIINVYDLRSEALGYNLPTVVRYMFGWTRIINSICLCLSLIKRKRIMSIVFFLNQLLSFGIDGMKSSIFILILDILIYFLYYNEWYKNTYNLLSFGFVAVSLGSMLEMVIFKTRWFIYLLFYRMEFLPVNISSNFFDFFTKHEPDYFRTSFLRFFGIKSPYENINYMISGIYSGDYGSQANNGLISDAITNMGYIGIIIMPIILVLFFRLFDRFSQGINKFLLLTLGIYCAMTFSNMFFLPNLLTGGWLVAMLMVLLIDREKYTGISELT